MCANEIILIGDVLKGVRKCFGVTQSELAEDMNISQSYISKLEKNEASPSVELLDKYEEYFGIDSDLLLKFRKLDNKKSLSKKIRISLFKKLVYDNEKDPWQDDTEM